MIIAVDYDNTLHSSGFNSKDHSEHGLPDWELIHLLIKARNKGARLILNTGREGDALIAAIENCFTWGLWFDAVNENLAENKPWAIERFGVPQRKVFADISIDDLYYNIDIGKDFIASWLANDGSFEKKGYKVLSEL